MEDLYIVQTGGWGGDVGGCLVDPNEGILWSHVSSDRDWLRQDLTESFGRRADLQARYPGGINFIEVAPGTATNVEAIGHRKVSRAEAERLAKVDEPRRGSGCHRLRNILHRYIDEAFARLAPR